MGEEIKYSRFQKADYQQFEKNLQQETELLSTWFHDHALSEREPVAGYELEAWLINDQCGPCPHNEAFLDSAQNPLIAPELAKFNIELNVEPADFGSRMLHDFEQQLGDLWSKCQRISEGIACRMLAIGILPTLVDEHLTLENISSLDRYRALNEQVLRFRHGESIRLDIIGEENLHVEHRDVMLEAAATSLQIHLQVPQHSAARYFNASVVLSAPMVAVCSNSPYLFGKDLWAETRIPVFEQSVDVGGIGGAAMGPVRRVGFGHDYVRESLLECFVENIEHYPALLPVEYDASPEEMRHLRLHNGTIWRWNRPLIGYDRDGTPHLRIEHRVAAAAPSVVDNISNIAFYYGLVESLATHETPPESRLDFATAKDNFYQAAQFGLDHRVTWLDGRQYRIRDLVLDRLLVEAEAGLYRLGISDADSSRYLGVVEERVRSSQTGTHWQRHFCELHGRDMQQLTSTYYNNQQTRRPVHEWDFETH